MQKIFNVGRRSGKSKIQVEIVKNLLNEGNEIYLLHSGKCEKIVGVTPSQTTKLIEKK